MHSLTRGGRMKKQTLKHVLSLMNEKKIALEKITIQKIIYFLREVGIPLQYKYEPYIYGPYSSDLNADLRSLALWKELSYFDNTYLLSDDIEFESMDENQLNLIAEKIDEFSYAIDNDFSFDSMEITGTAIYCHQALKSVGITPDDENVMAEFKNWKGDRYTDDKILSKYYKIKPLLN